MVRILLIVFALLCAGALSQFPEFYRQYVQRLGGTLDELTRQIESLDRRAEESGMGRFDYIRHFQSNADRVIQGEGDAMLDLLSRHVRFEKTLARLRQAPWHMHVIEVLFHFESDIATGTAKDFVPAIPLSVSGAAHFFLGFVLGLLIPLGCRSLLPFGRANAA